MAVAVPVLPYLVSLPAVPSDWGYEMGYGEDDADAKITE
jgi:hypothetical protein